MAGSDDRSLDLRLPWGRPSPPGPDGEADAAPERPAAGLGPRAERDRDRGAQRHDELAEPQPRSARRRDDEVAPDRELGGSPGESAAGSHEPDGALLLAATTGSAARLERLELAMLAWFARLEERAGAHNAAVEARLEKLESRLTAAHNASVEAVGLLAGHLVARLEEQVAGIEEAIETRHQRLVPHVEASLTERHTELLTRLEADRSATHEALGGLASGQLVERLVEGVVALGEVLDADLANLRRLIGENHLGPISPLDGEAADDHSALLEPPQAEGERDEPGDPGDHPDDGDDPPP